MDRVTAILVILLAFVALIWLRLSGGDHAPELSGGAQEEAAADTPTAVALPADSNLRRTSIRPPSDAAQANAADAPEQENETTAEPELGPITELWVLDAASQRHTFSNELRMIPRYYSNASVRVPGRGGAFEPLGLDLDSPIRLRGEFDSSATDASVRAITIEAANRTVRYALSEPKSGVRGFALYVRSRDCAWVRIDIDLREAGRRQAEMVPGASVRLKFENWRPADYDALGMSPHIAIRTAGDRIPISERSLGRGLSPPKVEIDGVSVGSHLSVEVKLGHRYRVRHRTVLAQVESVVEATKEHLIDVALADPPQAAGTATMAGTLRLPEFEGRDDAVLKLFAPDYIQGKPSLEIAVADMRRGSDRESWEFQAELPVARYHAKLWPLLASWIVDLPADGAQVDLVVDDIARLEVQVLDRITGGPASVESLFWRRLETLDGMTNHLGSRVTRSRTGAFVLHTTPGEVALRVDVDDPPLRGDASLTLGRGVQRHDLVVGSPTGIQFEFRVAGAVLPVATAGLPRIWVEHLDGSGRMVLSSMAVDNSIEVSEPGRYRVELDFKDQTTFVYAGEPIEVDVLVGRRTPVVVPLRRRERER